MLVIPDISIENHVKFLGIVIDDSISKEEHINSLAKILNSCLYVLKRIKHTSDVISSKTNYFALFESHKGYGLAVWSGTTSGNLNKILLLQKIAIRTKKGLSHNKSWRNVFIYIRELIVYVHNNKSLPRGKHIHIHYTRYASILQLPKAVLYRKKTWQTSSKWPDVEMNWTLTFLLCFFCLLTFTIYFWELFLLEIL